MVTPKIIRMLGPKTAIFALKYVNVYVIFTCHHETDNVVPIQEANIGRLGNLGYICPKDFRGNNFPFLYTNNMPSSPLIQLGKMSFILVFVCSQRQRGALSLSLSVHKGREGPG